MSAPSRPSPTPSSTPSPRSASATSKCPPPPSASGAPSVRRETEGLTVVSKSNNKACLGGHDLQRDCSARSVRIARKDLSEQRRASRRFPPFYIPTLRPTVPGQGRRDR